MLPGLARMALHQNAIYKLRRYLLQQYNNKILSTLDIQNMGFFL
jgi:hypothetical protein